MGSWYTIYRWGSFGLFATGCLPWIAHSLIGTSSRKQLPDRLGRYPFRRSFPSGPLIWMHAASMGEMAVAESIVAALKRLDPDIHIVLSAMTPHGLRHGADRMPQQGVSLFQAPLDVVPFVATALDRIRPDLLVFLETELWPNWIVEASKRGIPIALLNGRISARSIGRYHRIRPLMADILSRIDWFSMIHATDADRIASLGAPGNRIVVNGNAKYDRLCDRADRSKLPDMRAASGIVDGSPVFLAGSLRGNEPVMLIDTYRRLKNRIPELRMILAPRHLRRIPQIVSVLNDRRIRFVRKTFLDKRQLDPTVPWEVLLLDTMGDLFDAYGLADVVFCGGSFVPTGGQNVMEPAAWAKPVLYGPHMEDFLDAKQLLENAGGGLTVVDEHALHYHALRLLLFPDEARQMGLCGRSALQQHQGASERHAAGLMAILACTTKGDAHAGAAACSR
uniref:3-deoxy-D-manno-octulosonic acid transferase n=1 Tax=Desulfatirhabdium butyrativorans TaxID=340467 RepID=A0A7C4RUK3_9BACT